MEYGSYIYKLKFKPTAEMDGHVLFLAGHATTREEFLGAVRQYSEDLDVRTISFVEHLVHTDCKQVQVLHNLREEEE